MSYLKWLAYLTLLSGIGTLPVACKKAPTSQTSPSDAGKQTINARFMENEYVFGPENATTGYRYTELGRQYAPVFNVKNVMEAWNLLSANKIQELKPTHLYIKFTPQSPEELQSIAAAGIQVYTFPLDYEIKTAGDYMRDPAQEPNGMPPLYACLPSAVQLPAAQHQVLDELYLLDLRSVVAKKAFELAGEAAYYPGEPEEGETIPDNLLSANGNPDDHRNMDIQWGSYHTDIVFPPFPSDPVNPAQNVDNPPNSVANACACSNNGDDRMPSGCIKVEETQWWTGTRAFEGVNDVMADFVGPYFQRLSPMTNANGCYKSDRKIRYKVWTPFGTVRMPVYMSVIFASGKKTIKGLNHNGNMFEYALPMVHAIWAVQGGGLNNVNITYLRDWDRNHNETKYYSGATVNNAIYDYDAYAVQDHIQKSPDNLQVLVHKYSGSSAAPMFHKLLYSGSIPVATAAGFITATTGILPGVGTWGIGELMVFFPPDIAYGYDAGGSQVAFSTDQMKEEAYHELSHSSHYVKAGNDLWEKNIFFIATHNGYGQPGDNGVERSDLIEMWAYYNGRDLAHRRYGANRHSWGTFTNTGNIFTNSWFAVNERFIFDAGNHIAGGFLQDIRDDNGYNTANGLPEANGINDQVNGFSKSAIFSLMGSGTTTAESLIDQLGNQLPAGNTTVNYNTLRAGYGY